MHFTKESLQSVLRNKKFKRKLPEAMHLHLFLLITKHSSHIRRKPLPTPFCFLSTTTFPFDLPTQYLAGCRHTTRGTDYGWQHSCTGILECCMHTDTIQWTSSLYLRRSKPYIPHQLLPHLLHFLSWPKRNQGSPGWQVIQGIAMHELDYQGHRNETIWAEVLPESPSKWNISSLLYYSLPSSWSGPKNL